MIMSDEQQASVPLTSPHLTRAAVAAAANVYHQVAERYGREVERVMHSLHRLSAAALGTVRRTAARPPFFFLFPYCPRRSTSLCLWILESYRLLHMYTYT